ncbi:MAG TPA: substrate-binding domain-containing protein [Chryseosolibacter sp.]|nr:substrate-binding domain-containing protein [Chryseosolibacter sp.]
MKCGEVDAIAKSGIIRGKQRYYCKRCDYYFTIQTAGEGPTTFKRHQTTIIDIARELQISKSTVSRALHGHKDIHEETRKLVLEVAQRMDYQPNLLAFGLAKSRSQTIGIMVPEFINSFFPQVIIGAQDVANPAGYHVIICHSNESLDREIENTNVLMASRVDGVIASVTRETTNLDHFKKFEKAGIPIVYFNRVCGDQPLSKVMVDDYDGAFKGVEHLIKNGCKRIAHIAGPRQLQISRNRLKGYKDALLHYGLPVDESLILHHDLTKETARMCARHLFEMKEIPDGVFIIHDPAAIQAMLVAREMNISVPDQVAIVGFSNEPISEFIEPGLTTLAQPLEEMGKEAVEMLLRRINDASPEITHESKILKTSLIIRESSRKKNVVTQPE